MTAQKKPPFLLSPTDVLQAQKPTTLWLLEPYIPIGGVTFLFGRWSTFKTPLSVAMARAIAEGRSLWDLPVPAARPVLYIECDMAEPLAKERMKPMLEGVPPGTPLDFFYCYPGFDLRRPDADMATRLQELRVWHSIYPYAAVFIDALKGVTGGDLNDSQTVKETYAFFHRLFPGATLVFIHHSKKTRRLPNGTLEGNEEESFSGNQAWVNHATVSIQSLRRDRRKPHLDLCHYKSQISETGPDLRLRVKGGHSFTPLSELNYTNLCEVLETLPVDLTQVQQEKALAEHFGVSTRTIRRKLQEGETDDEADDADEDSD